MQQTKFPVPEEEAHKLDYVEEALEAQPLVQKLDDSVRSQPWLYMTGALVLGFCCGYMLSSR